MIYDNGDPVVINNKHHPWHGKIVTIVGAYCPIGGTNTYIVQLGSKVEAVAERSLKRHREMDRKVSWNDILYYTPEEI